MKRPGGTSEGRRLPDAEVIVVAGSEVYGAAPEGDSPVAIQFQLVVPPEIVWESVGSQEKHGLDEVPLDASWHRPSLAEEASSTWRYLICSGRVFKENVAKKNADTDRHRNGQAIRPPWREEPLEGI